MIGCLILHIIIHWKTIKYKYEVEAGICSMFTSPSSMWIWIGCITKTSPKLRRLQRSIEVLLSVATLHHAIMLRITAVYVEHLCLWIPPIYSNTWDFTKERNTGRTINFIVSIHLIWVRSCICSFSYLQTAKHHTVWLLNTRFNHQLIHFQLVKYKWAHTTPATKLVRL